MIRSVMLALLGGFTAALGVGCSPYVDEFHYAPHPAIAEIAPAATQPSRNAPPTLTAYATVVGVRRENRDQHIPLSIEVRLRLDNHGPASVDFDPRTLDLTNGELVRFPSAVVTPQVISVAPQQPVMVQANFPFPPGLSYDNLNLQTLQLHWTVQVDGQTVQQSTDFRRVFRYYEDPYYDYPPYAYYGSPYYGRPYVGVGTTFVIR